MLGITIALNIETNCASGLNYGDVTISKKPTPWTEPNWLAEEAHQVNTPHKKLQTCLLAKEVNVPLQGQTQKERQR